MIFIQNFILSGSAAGVLAYSMRNQGYITPYRFLKPMHKTFINAAAYTGNTVVVMAHVSKRKVSRHIEDQEQRVSTDRLNINVAHPKYHYNHVPVLFYQEVEPCEMLPENSFLLLWTETIHGERTGHVFSASEPLNSFSGLIEVMPDRNGNIIVHK